MSNRPDDDLFASTTMSFGDHIEELRKALFKSLLWLFIGVAIGFFFSARVVDFIQKPLTDALTDYYRESAEKELNAEHGGTMPPELDAMINDRNLIPEEVNVDPYGMIEALKASDPGQFGNLRISRHRFASDDISPTKASSLCARLVKDGKTEKESNPGYVIWREIAEKDQEQIKSWAEADELDAAECVRLIAILNGLLDRRSIFDSEAMSDATFLKGVRKNASVVLQRAKAPEADPPNDEELRRFNRLLIAETYPKWIARPHLNLVPITTWKPKAVQVKSLNAHESFMIWMKAAVVTGLVLASPMIFYFIWEFVAAGLYPHERKHIYVYLPFSIALFLGGAALAFFVVFRYVLHFLFGFNRLMNIDPDPRISEWMGFVIFLPVGFGISFQLPLVMLLLERIGIFTVESYLSKWRVAVLVIFVAAMFLTPADPVSMLLMGLPMTALYFGGILLCKWMPKFRNPYDVPDEV
jgi:sec-independent protein translocase protein TatC